MPADSDCLELIRVGHTRKAYYYVTRLSILSTCHYCSGQDWCCMVIHFYQQQQVCHTIFLQFTIWKRLSPIPKQFRMCHHCISWLDHLYGIGFQNQSWGEGSPPICHWVRWDATESIWLPGYSAPYCPCCHSHFLKTRLLLSSQKVLIQSVRPQFCRGTRFPQFIIQLIGVGQSIALTLNSIGCWIENRCAAPTVSECIS